MNIISLPDALNFYISPDTKVLSHFVPLLVSCRPEHLVNSCVLCSPVAQMAQLVSNSSLSLALINHSPRSGGAASIECWRAIFSTSCYPHIVPMMNRWLVKRFVLHLHIFHLYLIINKNTEKGMYLVIQERFSSNIWYVTIFANIPYPWNYFSISCIPITFSSNIPYPGNFFREYPVSRKPLMGPPL